MKILVYSIEVVYCQSYGLNLTHLSNTLVKDYTAMPNRR